MCIDNKPSFIHHRICNHLEKFKYLRTIVYIQKTRRDFDWERSLYGSFPILSMASTLFYSAVLHARVNTAYRGFESPTFTSRSYCIWIFSPLQHGVSIHRKLSAWSWNTESFENPSMISFVEYSISFHFVHLWPVYVANRFVSFFFYPSHSLSPAKLQTSIRVWKKRVRPIVR